jgi:hypothetical protein
MCKGAGTSHPGSSWSCFECKGKGYVFRIEKYRNRPTDNAKIDAHFIDQALEKRFGKPPWVYLPQLRNLPSTVYHGLSTIDGFAIHWGEEPLIFAYEIKVTRADFRKDIDNGKWEQWLDVSTHFYFITPPGLVSPDDVPPEAGLNEVTPRKSIKSVKSAPRRKIKTLPIELVQVMVKRLAILEGYKL